MHTLMVFPTNINFPPHTWRFAGLLFGFKDLAQARHYRDQLRETPGIGQRRMYSKVEIVSV